MGKVRTPKYRVEVKTNLTGSSKVISSWEVTKGHGRVNTKNLDRWVREHNESFLPKGVNYHVSKSIGIIPYVQEAHIVHQKTGEVLVSYKMSPFETF